jgi:RNA polymerase sigma-70 factor (ECF subfamily)
MSHRSERIEAAKHVDLSVSEEELIKAWREHHDPLVGLATGILRDAHSAEDAVQEAFLRLAFQPSGAISDLRGWLIVVVTRLCIDHARSARSRRETPVAENPTLAWPAATTTDPAQVLEARDDLRAAVSILLSRLTPAERAAFVLHDVFQMPFEQVAQALHRSPAACRQLASRARRALDGRDELIPVDVRQSESNAVAEQFAAACEGADLSTLLDLLAPDVVGIAEFLRFIPRRKLEGHEKIAHRLIRLFGGERFVLIPTPVDETAAGVVVVRRRDLRLVGVLELDVVRSKIVHINATNRDEPVARVTGCA